MRDEHLLHLLTNRDRYKITKEEFEYILQEEFVSYIWQQPGLRFRAADSFKISVTGKKKINELKGALAVD